MDNEKRECIFVEQGCEGIIKGTPNGPSFPPCAEGYELQNNEYCPFEEDEEKC